MLAYTFRKNISFKEKRMLSVEKFENIYDMFSVLLTVLVNNQLKRGLARNYIEIKGSLKRIKGSINISETIQKNVMINNEMICEYDEFSENVIFNQIIKTTMYFLIKSNKVTNKKYVQELKKTMLFFKEVDIINPNLIRWNTLQYNSNNKTYKFILNICYLILHGLIIKRENDKMLFLEFVDDQSVEKLFENFIKEFYIRHMPELNAKSSKIKWNITNNSIITLLPEMKTDVELTYGNKKLIIDAKYYSKILQKNKLYDKSTYHSNNLYQIFTYVKNEDKYKTGNVSGMLLYAETNEEKFEPTIIEIDTNKFYIDSIDLTSDFDTICKKLIEIGTNFKNQ